MKINFMIAKDIICIAIVVVVFFSCEKKQKPEDQEDFTLQGDTILIPKHSTILPKLKIEAVKEQEYKPELITAGTVKAIPNYYAEIAPPFSGRVTKVHMKLGMKTIPGTPLFEMVCPDFIDAQKRFFEAKSELQSSQLALKRQQDLKANGVGAQRDLEEAQTNFEIKEKEYQNTIASLKIFGVDIDKLVFGQPLIVVSPIAGEVLVNEIVMGSYLNSNDPPRAKVAELKRVWVVGNIKEKDLGFINALGEADIMIAAYPDKVITGKIFHINEIVDVDTRSVQVLIECPNSDKILKPGMYVTVNFKDKPEKTIFISAKAVLQFNDKSFVFLRIAKDTYVRKIVETGISEKDKIAVLSGLHIGDSIISEGAFYLLEAK